MKKSIDIGIQSFITNSECNILCKENVTVITNDPFHTVKLLFMIFFQLVKKANEQTVLGLKNIWVDLYDYVAKLHSLKLDRTS